MFCCLQRSWPGATSSPNTEGFDPNLRELDALVTVCNVLIVKWVRPRCLDRWMGRRSVTILNVCLNREGFQAIPHILPYKDQQMMVVAEDRHPLCLFCKQLGHLARFRLTTTISTKKKKLPVHPTLLLNMGTIKTIREKDGPKSLGKRNRQPRQQEKKIGTGISSTNTAAEAIAKVSSKTITVETTPTTESVLVLWPMLPLNFEFQVAAVYAPNIAAERVSFYRQSASFLDDPKWIVLAGYWNLILDLKIDRVGWGGSASGRCESGLKNFMARYDLVEGFVCITQCGCVEIVPSLSETDLIWIVS